MINTFVFCLPLGLSGLFFTSDLEWSDFILQLDQIYCFAVLSMKDVYFKTVLIQDIRITVHMQNKYFHI